MIDPTMLVYIVLGLGAIVIVLIVWIITLETRLKKLNRGKQGASLEEVITGLIQEVERLHDDSKRAEEHRAFLAEKLRSSVRGLSTVRFNPFRDSGGNQSFATALVNENGDGVIISTLFSRERMSIFGKPVKDFASDYDLTKEEAKALAEAKEQTS